MGSHAALPWGWILLRVQEENILVTKGKALVEGYRQVLSFYTGGRGPHCLMRASQSDPPFRGSVALGKLLNLSESQLPHVGKGDNNSPYFTGW